MHAVETRRLVKTFQSGDDEVPVLKGLDLSIRRGEFVSIMGPSGSGKSTLLHLVGLLDVPTKGQIRLMERDVSRLSSNGRARARRELLGFVFQSFHLMPRATALQNVMLPMAFARVPRRKRRETATRILRDLGLGDRLRHRSAQLSGGQKQRVAIARALALDPPILLADEPTGNLDSTTGADIMRLFRELHGRGKTIIQVTHDLAMARHGDRIIHILDGRIEREARRPVGGMPRPSRGIVAPPAPGTGRFAGDA